MSDCSSVERRDLYAQPLRKTTEEDVRLITIETPVKRRVNLRTLKQHVNNGKCMELPLISGIFNPSIFSPTAVHISMPKWKTLTDTVGICQDLLWLENYSMLLQFKIFVSLWWIASSSMLFPMTLRYPSGTRCSSQEIRGTKVQRTALTEKTIE